MINIKKVRHSFLSSLIVISLTIIPAPKTTEATGFPVVDLAGVVQMLVDFTVQISQQAQAITTAINSGLSVVEQIKEYTQMLEEYETTLNNLKDLGESIADGDFEAAYGLVSNSNLTEFMSTDILELSDEMLDLWVVVDDARRGNFGGARAIEDILEEAGNLYVDSPEVMELIEISQNRQSITTSSAAISTLQLDQISLFEGQLEKQQIMVRNLGGQSEIATLQALAQIMVFQSQLKVSEMRHDTARRESNLTIDEVYTRNMAKAVDDSITKTKIAVNTDVVYLTDEY
jgi:hypothetical protein